MKVVKMCLNPIAAKRVPSRTKLKFLEKERMDVNWEINNSDVIWLSCGKCIECRLQHARNWGSRCYLEMQEYETSYFLTLTYNDENVPRSLSGKLTLKKRDYQLFFKRLRKSQKENKIRYFGSGEYGSRYTKRPHYHFIVFGLLISDLKLYGRNELKQPLWTSDKINQLWRKGNVIVGDVTYESSSYVARYSLKKLNSLVDYGDKVPEFVVMSNGIAKEYLHRNIADIYTNDSLIIKTDKGSRVIKPFRYFDKKAESDYGIYMQAFKDKRVEIARLKNKNLMAQSNQNYKETLKSLEAEKNNSLRNLKKIL